MLSLTHSRKQFTECPKKNAARDILGHVLRHANALDANANYDHPLQRIQAFVDRGATLEIVLPAFPAKSPNREKTFSALPDFAEVIGLKRLQKLCDSISAFYAPGAKVLICSDGRVFSDLVLVSDQEVSAYGEAMRRIIREFNFRNLSTFDMDHVFEGKTYDSMRRCLVENHGRSLDLIREEVLGSLEAKTMFNGIHRFVFEDRVVLQPDKSRNKLREESKRVAYEVIQRSNSWSELVETIFPGALRLSIHPQFSGSRKIGFRLVDCENIWGTPWHNVACLGLSGFRLIKRKEAEALGATLAFAQGKYAFYREKGI